MASGFPPFAGVLTAVIGGLVVSFLMGSPVTIKGPAAGLIVIALGAVEELGQGNGSRGYRLALAVVVVAGILQILFGLLRSGRLGDFFPTAAVHGMLAAIGIIIASKQIHVVLGVKPEAKEPIASIMEVPHSLMHANAPIATIGLVSLVILFGWPLLNFSWTKKVPAQLVVLAVAIPLGKYFGLDYPHDARVLSLSEAHVGPEFLVKVPDSLGSILTFPDFSQVASSVSIKYIIMFALVGSLESILSAKAIDSLDPYGRKSNLDRDLVAVGIGNTLSGLLGGLPMIAEIVRSSANLQNGAKTRWANFFHGVFLLGCIALIPGLVHRIPLAALAAMLVYTGCRLASPKEFVHTFKIGSDQLAIFVATIVVTLATDLLVGVGTGVALKLVLHLARGVKLAHLLKPTVEIASDRDEHVVTVKHAVLFTNFLPLKAKLDTLPKSEALVIDLRQTYFVDHTVLSHLETLRREREANGGRFEVRGLEQLRAPSGHPKGVHIRPLSEGAAQ